MDARKIAAQFAAYVWFEKTRGGQTSSKEASHFARQNWMEFLPAAPKGVGELLLRLAERPKVRSRRLGKRSNYAAAG